MENHPPAKEFPGGAEPAAGELVATEGGVRALWGS